MKHLFLKPAFGLILALGSNVSAQSPVEIPSTDFAQVSISGTLNLRAGPTTEAERMTRVVDGQLLRLVACKAGADQVWCEVETLDGGIEGWAAAQFLRNWFGADPAVLESPAVAPNERVAVEAPGRFAGQLDQGEVFDLLMAVPKDGDVIITLDAPDSVGIALFSMEGSVIETARGGAEIAAVLLDSSEVLVRIADMAGAPADWGLDVRLD